jgi:hypothetical protein
MLFVQTGFFAGSSFPLNKKLVKTDYEPED